MVWYTRDQNTGYLKVGMIIRVKKYNDIDSQEAEILSLNTHGATNTSICTYLRTAKRKWYLESADVWQPIHSSPVHADIHAILFNSSLSTGALVKHILQTIPKPPPVAAPKKEIIHVPDSSEFVWSDEK